MPNDPGAFLRACIRNGFILDTNTFLLLTLGTSHKKTLGYDEELKIVRRIASYCSENKGKLVLTPHIVSEVSNILINRSKRHDFSENQNFTKKVEFIKNATEHQVEKDVILNNTHLNYIGFTDLSILEAAKKEKYGVLTMDGELFCRLCDDSCFAAIPKVIAEAKAMSAMFELS